MEFQHSENSNLYENAQQTLPHLAEEVHLSGDEFPSEGINIDGITIVPQDDRLNVSFSDDLHNNQKPFKLSDSEFIPDLNSFHDDILKKPVDLNQINVSNIERKHLEGSTNFPQKPSNDILKKFCNDITTQKLSVMQGLIRKEYNDKAGGVYVSNYITAIEQPSIGVCSCFICGMTLPDRTERYTYLDHQRLLGVKLTFLQFLSEILCQKVLTNSPEINLCQRCSDLINEADSISKQLGKIKNEIEKYFNGNERPKLTYQIIPHFSDLISKAKKEMDENSGKAELSLRELALTRPRHRKKVEDIDKNLKSGSDRKKKALGRPRKPFQCPICKLKFISNLLLHRHGMKEHMTKNGKNVRQINIPTINNDVSTINHHKITGIHENEVCDENYPENKIDKLLSLNKKLPIIPETTPFHRFPDQRCSSLPPMPMRPIQPKPQTLYQVNNDGSLAFLMGPVGNESTAALVTVTPSYTSLSKHFYSCDLCVKKFEDENSFKMHRIAAHGIRKKKVTEQIFDANSEKKYNDSAGKNCECVLCESIFPNKTLLFQHMNSIHFVDSASDQKCGRYKCEHCNKCFSFKHEMDHHKEVHSQCNKMVQQEFVCSLCKLRLTSKAAFRIHLHRFHKTARDIDDKEYLCAKCGYMTHTRRSFMDHAKHHKNRNVSVKMQCQLCKKVMLTSSFKIHMARMHSEPKHACELCGKKFPIKSDLSRHNTAIHSNVRPNNCNQCRRKFFTPDSLRYHTQKAHSTDSFYCDVCDSCFTIKEELQIHNDECHKTIYECPLCPRFYVDHHELKLHLATLHKVYAEVGNDDQDDAALLSNRESEDKEQNPSPDRELNMEKFRSRVLISAGPLVNDPAMSAAQSGIEHIDGDVSAELRAVKMYQEPVEESIVLTSLHEPDSFQNEVEIPMHSSPFVAADNGRHLDSVFADGKHADNARIEPSFSDELHNVGSIYVVRQYDETS